MRAKLLFAIIILPELVFAIIRLPELVFAILWQVELVFAIFRLPELVFAIRWQLELVFAILWQPKLALAILRQPEPVIVILDFLILIATYIFCRTLFFFSTVNLKRACYFVIMLFNPAYQPEFDSTCCTILKLKTSRGIISCVYLSRNVQSIE